MEAALTRAIKNKKNNKLNDIDPDKNVAVSDDVVNPKKVWCKKSSYEVEVPVAAAAATAVTAAATSTAPALCCSSRVVNGGIG